MLSHCRWYILGITLLLLVGGLPAAKAQTSLHDAATTLTSKLVADPDVMKITNADIVIAPFENINGSGDAVPHILQEMLTTSFIESKQFTVVERDQLQKGLDELHFQLSDLADSSKAQQIGKIVGADYILLGSISDTGDGTYIDARVVSVATGKSIAAADTEIASTTTTPIPASITPPASTGDITDKTVTAPSGNIFSPHQNSINLNQKATYTVAGQWEGSKESFGLLGQSNFNVAWREDLGTEPITSFTAGDTLGDGSSRLVIIKTQEDGAFSFSYVDVLKWDENIFKTVWQSTNNYGGNHVLLLPSASGPPAIAMTGSNAFLKWNGTTYISDDIARKAWLQLHYNITLSDTVVGSPNKFVGFDEPQGADFINLKDGIDNFTLAEQTENFGVIAVGPASAISSVTSGDYDGDGQVEIAVGFLTKTAEPIEIYDKQGNRKAITSAGYGGDVTTWKPKGAIKPFIVARRNTFDADKNPNGGNIYFIRWNGESYEEFWKSNTFPGSIIEMHVCDPKGEGSPGLVVLSYDGKDYYLTKIAAS
jgi:TolB-like protein